LYPETGDFIVRNGKFSTRKQAIFVAENGNKKYPLSGYKVSCFENQYGQALTNQSS